MSHGGRRKLVGVGVLVWSFSLLCGGLHAEGYVLHDERFRIVVDLSQLVPQSLGRDGEQPSFVESKSVARVLRAHTRKENHFFIGNYRVTTTPMRWIRETGHFDLKVAVFYRFGIRNEMIHELGWLQVAGRLDPSPEPGLFRLIANGSKTIPDGKKNQRLRVDLYPTNLPDLAMVE